ncbi:SRPBCC family protein [Mycolicibacterium mengxianglii]|uniref:SRPBCC family protein n=1 Tax=Mycolicibacterium mengxianglii TaxID=2736649 RepID=UPI0018EF11EE|nr:SRPBCC family protein [Mycolicibacterium mengxianglii]
MAHTSRTRRVGAPPQTVWEVLADFGSVSYWAQSVDHSCLLHPGPDGGPIGSARRIQIGRTTLIERIVEFDEPHTLSYDIEGLPAMLGRLRNRWELRPAANQFTAVTLTTSADIGTHLAQRLLERVACRIAAAGSDGLLAGLASQWKDHHVA